MSQRCGWAEGNDLLRHYHDTEWGVPLRDDRVLFEYMVLDAFQAGLSWAIILKKREGFRAAFHDFDPEAIARYRARDVQRLLKDEGIVRNRQKIEATIGNAQADLDLLLVTDSVEEAMEHIEKHAVRGFGLDRPHRRMMVLGE